MNIKRKKINPSILMIIFLITIATGMTAQNAHYENDYIKYSFYQSVDYNPAKDLLSFTIPKKVPEGFRFYLHVSGRMYMGDKFSGMSFHAFEEENQSSSWINGKTYTYSLNSKGLDFCLLLFGLIDKNNVEHLSSITIFPDGTKCIDRAD
jgi:hypothetical protein